MSNAHHQSSFFFTSLSQGNSAANSNSNLTIPDSPSNEQHPNPPISTSPSSASNLAEVGRRYSNGFSRMAFSIYGNQFNPGSPNRSSFSSGNSPTYSQTATLRQSYTVQQISPSSITSTIPDSVSRRSINGSQSLLPNSGHLHSNNSYTDYNLETERVVYHTLNEVLACAKAHETPNLIAMATPKNLQLLKVSGTDIALEQELSMKLTGNRAAKFGIISDLSFGHQQYGRHLVAGTINGSIHVFNLDRGARVKTTLIDHQRAVNTLDFNHINGHTLLSGSQDGRIKLWDLRMNNTRASLSLNGNADAVRGAQFNPKKANILAAVFDNGVIEKWDIRKPNTWERRINAHTGPALAVDWHPELEYIVTGGRDKQLQVWNLATGYETREPTDVINTSGPILKATWCKGSGNRSIYDTDIATCFLNDDPCIQIWNLNRKYIPKSIIECHSGQITQLVWRTPKHLISSSKDKSLVQQDVSKAPAFIDNLTSAAMAWNPRSNCDFVFLKQEKAQFEKNIYEIKKNTTTEAVTLDSQSNSNLQPSLTNSSSGVSISSPRLNSVASASSFGSVQQQRRSQVHPDPSKSFSQLNPAIIVPAHVIIDENNTNKFDYLSSNYIIEVPEDSNIIDVCDHNASLAQSIGFYREYQTWTTIKAAIGFDLTNKIESEMKEETIHVNSVQKYQKKQEEEEDNESNFGKIESNSKLGTSYGSMMSFSDRSDVLADIDQRLDDITPINESGEINVTIDDGVNNDTAVDGAELKSDSDSNILKGDNESLVSEKSATLPINIRRSKHRSSFTSSVDFDDEKNKSLLSCSTSPMIRRDRSSLFNEAHAALLPLISRSVETRESKSKLTEIMKKKTFETTKKKQESITPEEEKLALPWDPSKMIKSVLDYESNEGNILLCAAFALLFKGMYPESMTNEQAEEWILLYHELLTRNSLFINAATVVDIASKRYLSFKKLGQTQTSVRTICAGCLSPILNEKSKERFQSGESDVNFGFWYCDKCGTRQGNCVYCDQPIRGNAVGMLNCGHVGHFDCLKVWFVDEAQLECPGC